MKSLKIINWLFRFKDNYLLARTHLMLFILISLFSMDSSLFNLEASQAKSPLKKKKTLHAYAFMSLAAYFLPEP